MDPSLSRQSPELRRAIDQFNRGEFFACHETLEGLWIHEPGALRELYQGILQVAVGFYHHRRGNQRGAILCLERGLRRLGPFRPACQGIDVGRLVTDAALALTAILSGAPAEAAGDLELKIAPWPPTARHPANDARLIDGPGA